MTTETVTQKRGDVLRHQARPWQWLTQMVAHYALIVYAALALAYLFIPIAVVVLFSFNNIRGRFNFVWQGFSLNAWRDPFAIPALTDAMILSVKIAAISTVIATALGTLIALALIRYRFIGSSGINLLILLPLTTPEVVMGSSLLTLVSLCWAWAIR